MPWFVSKVGAAIHGDHLRTIIESKKSVNKQASVVDKFAKALKLKLNSSKPEIMWLCYYCLLLSICRCAWACLSC